MSDWESAWVQACVVRQLCTYKCELIGAVAAPLFEIGSDAMLKAACAGHQAKLPALGTVVSIAPSMQAVVTAACILMTISHGDEATLAPKLHS